MVVGINSYLRRRGRPPGIKHRSKDLAARRWRLGRDPRAEPRHRAAAGGSSPVWGSGLGLSKEN